LRIEQYYGMSDDQRKKLLGFTFPPKK